MSRIDPYTDGICSNIKRSLKKRGVAVDSKEGVVRKSSTGMGWEVRFPEGTAEVYFTGRSKEWEISKWRTNK
jgi:hypothetical protein